MPENAYFIEVGPLVKQPKRLFLDLVGLLPYDSEEGSAGYGRSRTEGEVLVLASASPRRRDLLDLAGVKYRPQASRVKEHSREGESAADFALRAAGSKARAVAAQATAGDWVLAADTIVTIDDRILGKPADARQAREMLARLSGRDHRVLTGVELLKPGGATFDTRLVETAVTFRPLDDRLIDGYVATGEPFDKAGAYGIQGKGAVLVSSISGSYTNVVGLPLVETLEMLEAAGVFKPFEDRQVEIAAIAGGARTHG